MRERRPALGGAQPRRCDGCAGGGFTLLEMLIALAVFAVIGVMSTQLVRQIADMGDNTRRFSDELVALQRAADIIGRDVQQLAHRPVRDELGDAGHAVAVNQRGLLEFTRRGWANPLRQRRSELQRVAYRVAPEGLQRLFWPVLDRAEDTQPIPQLLLAGVTEVAVLGIDEDGEEHGYWPTAEAGEAQLAALVVRIMLPRYGEIERLWVVPSAPAAPAADDELFDDEGEADGDDADEPPDEPGAADVDGLA